MTAHVKNTGENALDLLRQDHETFGKLFSQYAALEPGALSGDRKMEIIQEVCRALDTHAQIEEELFYPALREAGDASRPPAGAEHAAIRRLAEELRNAKPGDALADSKMKVLSEYVRSHVDKEESELFAEARSAGFDLRALGDQIDARRAELVAGDAATLPVAVVAARPAPRKKRAQARA